MKQRPTTSTGGGPTWRRLLATASVVLLGASTLLACTAILGIEEATLIEGAGGQGGGGGSGGCQLPAHCDDDNRCTVDDCDAQSGECSNEAVADGPAPDELQLEGDCQRVICASGQSTTEADDTDLPVDDNQCTDDLCNLGSPSNPAVANGTACTEPGGKICYQTECVDCYNNTHCTSPNECGGGGTPLVCGCTPEACDSLTCGFAPDWKCSGGIPDDCNDSQLNGTETDVDCGGPQPPPGGSGTCSQLCGDGRLCNVNNDCASGNCIDCSGTNYCTSCP